MKRFLSPILVLCSLLLLTTSTWAYTINQAPYIGTDPGLLDTLVDSAKLINSGLSIEQAWVTDNLGAGYTIVDPDIPLSLFTTSTAHVIAISLPDEPDYFYIKTGKVTSGGDHFLYANLDEMNWGVVDISAWGTDASIGKISHVGETGGTSVPEPTTMLLLGLGLLGLAGLKRRLWN